MRAEACASLDARALRFLDAIHFAVPDDGDRGRRHVHPGLLARRLPHAGGAAQLQIPLGWGTLGYAFPAALGAALAGAGPDGRRLRRRRLPVRLRGARDGRPGADPAHHRDRRRRRLRDAALRPGRVRRGALRRRPAHAGLRRARGGFGIRAETVDGLDDEFGEALAGTSRTRRRRVLVARTPEPLVPPPNTSPNWYRRDAPMAREQVARAPARAASPRRRGCPRGGRREAAAVGLPGHAAGRRGARAGGAAAGRDAPRALTTLVIAYALRGAPLAVAPADLRGVHHRLDAARRGPRRRRSSASAAKTLDRRDRAGRAGPRERRRSPDALDDGPLERDDFHQALRERLPGRAAVVVPRLPEPPRPPVAVAGDAASAACSPSSAGDGAQRECSAAPAEGERGSRTRRASWRAGSCVPMGRRTPAVLAAWAGIGAAPRAARSWAAAGELAEVDVDGGRRWLLADDLGRRHHRSRRPCGCWRLGPAAGARATASC